MLIFYRKQLHDETKLEYNPVASFIMQLKTASATIPHTSQSSNRIDRRLLVLAMGMFSLGTDSFVVAGVLPQVSRAFHASIGAAGQMTTVYALAYAVLAPTIAALAASVPRKRLLQSGLLLFVLANLATALAPSLLVALITRAFAGLGAAMFAPTATGSASMMVQPEKRGFALSVVIAGLTAATALGSPIGSVIGGLGDWRWTMVFVSAIAAIALTGVSLFLTEVPLPPKVSLAKRLAPIGDPRVALTLATTLLYMAGLFTVYTYFSVVFDQAVGGSTLTMGGLLVLWGGAGTLSNILIGRVIDSVGTRKILLGLLIAVGLVLATLPVTGMTLWTAIPAIAAFGALGWGTLVPQQHRLVSLAPDSAPVVLGLNTASTYLGVTAAGLIGASGIQLVGAHQLGFVGAFFIGIALITAELASRKIHQVATNPVSACSSAPAAA